jgi:NagD protein
MATALTLTGATDRCALINSPVQPDYVIESVGELIGQTEYNEFQE